MADHLTPDQVARIDAIVARVHAERADAKIMGARYDDACEQIVELHDEIVRLRRRADALEDQLADRDIERRRTARDLELLIATSAYVLLDRARVQALADRRWIAWQSARRRARQQRADRNLTHAVEDERASDTHPETNRSTTT
ncbi:hypothetical protein NE857_21470 [Nocardiopsis exhalans]|uniref:Uncharacterized protein n=1 Tax=Nocardiopsis exhalans TaxID=163604 RepID=A0ABY5D1M1_9ACTN|nr:hypothetical protein [Nocardiopsis exhalans]USY17887.1 hypothetical protein NE857_21470 [Nocardiopsis exhalans]